MLSAIEQTFAAIEELTGLSVVWKYVDGRTEDFFLPFRYFRHSTFFCRSMKSTRAGLRACIVNDFSDVVHTAEQVRTPFVHTCYAGVSELIVPLFNEQGKCLEIIALGVFRKRDSVCSCDAGMAAFPQLPLYDEAKIDSAAKLLSSIAGFLQDERKRMSFDHVSESLGDLRIRQCVKHLEKHLGEHTTAQAEASRLALSRSGFLNLFRQQTGMSFRTYLLSRRLAKAYDLLGNSALSLAEIAWQCGFSNQSRFTMLFRREKGITPGEYRQHIAMSRH